MLSLHDLQPSHTIIIKVHFKLVANIILQGIINLSN